MSLSLSITPFSHLSFDDNDMNHDDYGDDDDDCDCFEILSAVPPCSLLPLIAAPISAGSATVLVVLLVVYYTLATSSILAY